MGEPVDIQALGRSIHEALILARLREGPRHGYQIALDVERASEGSFAFQHGTLYPILHRLERDGRIDGRWDRSSGRRRKVYGLTRAGRAYLDEQTDRIESAFRGLRRALSGRE